MPRFGLRRASVDLTLCSLSVCGGRCVHFRDAVLTLARVVHGLDASAFDTPQQQQVVLSFPFLLCVHFRDSRVVCVACSCVLPRLFVQCLVLSALCALLQDAVPGLLLLAATSSTIASCSCPHSQAASAAGRFRGASVAMGLAPATGIELLQKQVRSANRGRVFRLISELVCFLLTWLCCVPRVLLPLVLARLQGLSQC